MLTTIFYNTFYRGKRLTGPDDYHSVRCSGPTFPSSLQMSKENMSSIIQSSWGMEWQDEPVLEWLTDRSMSNEVAECDGEVVGYYCLEITDRYIFITSIQVDRSHQGPGPRGYDDGTHRDTGAGERDGRAWNCAYRRPTSAPASFYQERGYEPIWRKGSNVMMRKRLPLTGRKKYPIGSDLRWVESLPEALVFVHLSVIFVIMIVVVHTMP